MNDTLHMHSGLWARLPGESSQAHEAFEQYLKLGARRSLATLARTRKGLQPGTGTVAVPGRLKLWSSRWRWQERAEAWDRRLDEQVRAEVAEVHRRARVRHAAVASGHLKALSVPSFAVLTAVRDGSAMEALVARARASPGGLLELVRLAADAGRAVPELVAVERVALGLPARLSGAEIEIGVSREDRIARAIRLDSHAAGCAVALLDAASQFHRSEDHL